MRKGLLTALWVAALLLPASAADASFHLIKIREVGQGGVGGADYVVLQMYASGQNLVQGKMIRTYDQFGMPASTFEFPANVGAADSQRTIYVAGDAGDAPGTPDFTTANLIVGDSGAVCFGASLAPGGAVDCVSFGGFAASPVGLPSPTGSPAPSPAAGQALRRSIAPGCPTLLEAADDTDDSAADFAIAAQSPRNNSTQPTETACGAGGGATSAPQTKITKRPAKRSARTKAKLKFSSSEPGSKFECKLDRGKFKRCTSPRKYRRLKPGKHRFKVRATDASGNTDPTPAKARWRVIR